MPEHHLHISTGFLFVTLFFLLGIGCLIYLFFEGARAAKRRANQMQLDHELEMARLRTPTVAPFPRARQTAAPAEPPYERTRQTPPPPTQVTPVTVVHTSDGMSGFVPGLIAGELLAGGHSGGNTTIINNEPTPSHSAPDSGFTSPDSGFTYDSGGSLSNDSSGGFDVSW